MTERIEGFRGTFALADLAAVDALAARIAAGLRRNNCVALKGELGAGKTTLARAILRALGVSEYVPSPTFTLVQTYETSRGTVSHFDLYRLESSRDLDELGFDDALEQGIVLVEWPERVQERLSPDTLTILLKMGAGNGREAFVSGTEYWRRFLAQNCSHD